MIYNELDYIKIPEGMVRKWREGGIYRTMIFYYKLKPLNKLGKFSKKEFYKIVHNNYQISDSNIRLHLNKLIELGFIRSSHEFYQLISYDKLFAHFNYDLSYKRSKSGKILRRGCFAIDKIDLNDIEVLEDRIDCGEIKLNIRRQEYFVKKVALSEKMSNTLKKSVSCKGIRAKCTYDGSNIKLSKSAILKVKDHLIITKDQQKINTVVGISCIGLCKLLGYKSTKSVHDLKHRSANYGLVTLQEQEVVFKDRCNILDEVLLMKLRPNFRFKGKFGEPLKYQLQDNFFFNF